MLPNVGFPSGGPPGVMVSKQDYALMLSFVDALKDWIAAASGCLKAGQ